MVSSPEKCAMREERILIVDDNAQTAAFMRDLLESASYRAQTCDSGQGAISTVLSGGIDLVLLDVVMPDINGLTVASQIKSICGPDDFLPVIMVTALAGEEDKIAGLTYADDYITKPFSGEELLARVISLLRIRRLHRELVQSTGRYRLLYDNSPHMYLSIDSSRVITDCNLMFSRQIGIEKEAVLGREIFSLFVKEDYPVLDHFLKSLDASGPSLVQERVFRLSVPGRSEPMMVNMMAVYAGDMDAGLAIVIVMEDVTKRLKLEEEQRIARRQLYRSARLASIGTLASGVAHEMNNPLTAILGFSSALLDRVQSHEAIDRDELGQYLQIINNETLRCRDIVENLSKFAREGDFLAAQVSLLQCIDDAIKLTNAKAAKSNIAIINEMQQDVTVRADPGKLEQVIINVLANSFEFCSEGAVVRISADYTASASSRYATLRIADNGPGIAPDILPKVFDPFFTTKEVGRGTGMGLAICHKIMEECNGAIDILSDGENGTMVVLEIPREQNSTAETELA